MKLSGCSFLTTELEKGNHTSKYVLFDKISVWKPKSTTCHLTDSKGKGRKGKKIQDTKKETKKIKKITYFALAIAQ
jgi:hypothetical protein